MAKSVNNANLKEKLFVIDNSDGPLWRPMFTTIWEQPEDIKSKVTGYLFRGSVFYWRKKVMTEESLGFDEVLNKPKLSVVLQA